MTVDIQRDQYLQDLNEKGYIEVRDFHSKEKIKRVLDIIEAPLNRPTINGNKGYVKKNNVRFLFSTLSWGRDIIDLYTNPTAIGIIEDYIEAPVHLSNYRIYRTFPSRIEKMHWHVDNKIDVYDEKTNTIVHKMIKQKGIIMIMYLSDVQDGGFQIVEGSHHWSIKEETKESWNDREKDFQDKIVTFNNRPAGTTIIYDYRCVHRAKPYQGGQIRTSLFGQYSPPDLPVGENILLNVRDIADLSDLQKRILNIGKAPSSENWPIGNPGELVEDLGFGVIKSFMLAKAKKVVKGLGFSRK